MAQETRWLKALSATSKLDVADGELTLRDAHGKALARLVPAPEAP
jgi:heat shock protein HslJ